MMTAFLIIAAVMTAVAAAAVAIPLTRDPRSRAIAAVAVVLMAGTAAGLYDLWSNWNWHASAATAGDVAVNPQIAAMISKLEAHMRRHPDDLSGWVMLGRSYVATGRMDEAILAYDRAQSLSGGKSFDAAIGYGEALAVQAGGEITPQAAQLFEKAIALEPDNPKALLYGGFAAAVRGEDDLARKRWQTLLAMNPPEPVVKLLNARLAELPPPGAGAVAAGAGAPAGADVAGPAGATVHIRLEIAPGLKDKLRAPAALFVFAEQPGAGGPPLAVKRLTTAAIGGEVDLSAADSMVPGRAIANGEHVVLMARVSFDGQPLPASGDLYGELAYDVGSGGTARLLIDKVQP